MNLSRSTASFKPRPSSRIAPPSGGADTIDSGSSSGSSGSSGGVDAGDTGSSSGSSGSSSGSSGGDVDGGGTVTGSCVGKCGKYQQGASCQCDKGCEKYKDCCPDKAKVCGGSSGGSCALPTSFSNGQWISSLQLLDSKQGCDLDNNGKINNLLGTFVEVAPQVNTSLSDAIKSGDLVLLLAPDKWQTNGAQMTIDMLEGGKSGSSYYAKKVSYDVTASATTCPALSQLTGAKVIGGKLSGTSATPLTLNLALLAGTSLGITLTKVVVTADVSGTSSWSSSSNGKLCGVVKKSDLEKAIDAIPEADLKQLGFDKATLKALINGILVPDIDGDGDGSKESISAAFSFTTQAATISGVQ